MFSYVRFLLLKELLINLVQLAVIVSFRIRTSMCIYSNHRSLCTCYRNLLAFSTDKVVHIYQFSTTKEHDVSLKLVATLSGHFSEVTRVRWNRVMKKWVTASEDGTIRTWVSLSIVCDLRDYFVLHQAH